MRVLVSPDKFKGSLSATVVADNIAKGLAQSGADAVTLPLADGGDGSVAAALAAGMRPVACTVTISQIDDLEAGLENLVSVFARSGWPQAPAVTLASTWLSDLVEAVSRPESRRSSRWPPT
jgi:hypothetical protein